MKDTNRSVTHEIEIDEFHTIYYFEFGKDFSHPPEKHDFWELVYVDSGEIDAVTDGLGRRLRQGEVIFHRPMELHAHVSNRIVSNNMLVVSFSSKSPAMDFFDRKVFTLGKTEKTLLSLFLKEAEIALGRLPGDYRDKNPIDFSGAPAGSTQLLECYLLEFLLVLKRGGEESHAPSKHSEDARSLAQSSILELIISYMQEHVRENLTLSDICKRFYMGKSGVCQLFADHMSASPIEYFSGLKIAEAKRMLLLEGMTVNSVSDSLGYSSIHTFSRAFNRAVGKSPSEYRKMLHHQG